MAHAVMSRSADRGGLPCWDVSVDGLHVGYVFKQEYFGSGHGWWRASLGGRFIGILPDRCQTRDAAFVALINAFAERWAPPVKLAE